MESGKGSWKWLSSPTSNCQGLCVWTSSLCLCCGLRGGCFTQDLVCAACGGLLTSVALFWILIVVVTGEGAKGSQQFCRAQGFSAMRIGNNDLFYCSVSFKLRLIGKSRGILKHGKKRPSREKD